MATEKDKEATTVRPFADFLRDQNRGRTHEELSQALHDLIAQIKLTGRKGELLLKIAIEPNKKNADVLQVSDVVVVKAPQPDRKASLFYTDDDGNLSRQDPNQLTFDGPLREVPKADDSAETKEKRA